jgi:hypothetical protein
VGAINDEQDTYSPDKDDSAEPITRASPIITRQRDRGRGVLGGLEMMAALHRLVYPDRISAQTGDCKSEPLNRRVQEWREQVHAESA